MRERLANEAEDRGALRFLPFAHPRKLSLAHIDLEVRPPALVEPEQLARDSHEALAWVVRVADDLADRVQCRRARALHHEPAASGEKLVDRREVRIHGGHRDVGLMGDVAP